MFRFLDCGKYGPNPADNTEETFGTSRDFSDWSISWPDFFFITKEWVLEEYDEGVWDRDSDSSGSEVSGGSGNIEPISEIGLIEFEVFLDSWTGLGPQSDVLDITGWVAADNNFIDEEWSPLLALEEKLDLVDGPEKKKVTLVEVWNLTKQHILWVAVYWKYKL